MVKLARDDSRNPSEFVAAVERGFAVLTRADGRVITEAESVAVGDDIRARLHRGVLRARITGHESGSDS